jgi:hypothetical protein
MCLSVFCGTVPFCLSSGACSGFQNFFTVLVPAPALVPVPTLKLQVIFTIKAPALDLVCFFSHHLHAWVSQSPVRVLFNKYPFLSALQ